MLMMVGYVREMAVKKSLSMANIDHLSSCFHCYVGEVITKKYSKYGEY